MFFYLCKIDGFARILLFNEVQVSTFGELVEKPGEKPEIKKPTLYTVHPDNGKCYLSTCDS